MAGSDDGFQLALSELIEGAAADAHRHSSRPPTQKARPQGEAGERPNKRAKLSTASSLRTDVHRWDLSDPSSSAGTSVTSPGEISYGKTRLSPPRLLEPPAIPTSGRGPRYGSSQSQPDHPDVIPRGVGRDLPGPTPCAASPTSYHQPTLAAQVVRRQFNAREDEYRYEALLEARRRERVINVDRYVPPFGYGPPSKVSGSRSAMDGDTGMARISYRHERAEAAQKPQICGNDSVQDRSHRAQNRNPRSATDTFRFQDLPEKVKSRVMSLLLVKQKAIVIDFTWAATFVHGHCRVPSATKTLRAENQTTYTLPQHWPTLMNEVQTMQDTFIPFQNALAAEGGKNRCFKGPCRGLTTGLLRVSRSVHNLAAKALYGENTFRLFRPDCAWMQLESFLATITTKNVAHLRSLEIHVPLWHRGMERDYLEGAILDLTAPASRLAVVESMDRDRLLSAITSSVHALRKANNLSRLVLILNHGLMTDHWIGRHANDRELVSLTEAEQAVARKQSGIQSLQKLAELVAPNTIKLRVQHIGASRIQGYDTNEFTQRLPGLRREAAKYGWQVDHHLEGKRRSKAVIKGVEMQQAEKVQYEHGG
ncbi:hypothetical protein CERZMDRAFT_92276 [Cercospora zeae-maydis SCOH1-5]|uniref:Uncharacterized protein n=1 Tax=Cercospora zeae-maydis SCOH1-5 TaxID=717836 RepID=A0A6A6FW82_9PEZI|nr:hypothetical protein CERZMDRAFT_92276 [Cercospora zeae-maydis SCOH1-5]